MVHQSTSSVRYFYVTDAASSCSICIYSQLHCRHYDGTTTEISVDGTHEEGNGNGNANARRPSSGKCPGKGTHPPASEMFVNCAPSNTISSPNDANDVLRRCIPTTGGDRIGGSLLNDVEHEIRVATSKTRREL